MHLWRCRRWDQEERCSPPRRPSGSRNHRLHRPRVDDAPTTTLAPARGVLHGAVHGHPRRCDRECRPPLDPPRLGFSAIDLQWIVNAYTIAFAGFLMLGGRAADLFGQRRMFVAGFLLFAAASLAGGLAGSRGMLIGARAAQGFGGAIMAPASLAIITSSFTEGAERIRAVGLWGAMNGAGGAAGTLLGGIITQELSWRWILFINVPIGIAAALVARVAVEERRRRGDASPFDLGG